jgi:hypothetical protein
VEDGQLAFDVATSKVELAAHADPDGFELEAGGRRCRRSRSGMNRLEGQRPAAACRRNVPRGWKPLRRQVERLEADVLEAERTKAIGDPLLRHLCVLRPGNPPPVPLSIIPTPARESGELVDVRLQTIAVERGVALIARRQRQTDGRRGDVIGVPLDGRRLGLWTLCRHERTAQSCDNGGQSTSHVCLRRISPIRLRRI